jgi:pimeloyl-ACP methyl ester carboxylesterase
MRTIHYRAADVNGLKISYREAGRTDAPTLLLLHGFPTAGHMFRDLIPLLADSFHLVAPDLPGFGQSDLPPRLKFNYTFERLAETIDHFTENIGLKRFAIYIFDYGAPVGLRIALKHPERISAIVSQNGNAYEEGLSDGWNPIRAYWEDPSQANRDALRALPAHTHGKIPRGVAHNGQFRVTSGHLGAATLTIIVKRARRHRRRSRWIRAMSDQCQELVSSTLLSQTVIAVSMSLGSSASVEIHAAISSAIPESSWLPTVHNAVLQTTPSGLASLT